MQYMKLDLQKNERIRMDLFNMVQKLKGPMRVYCRVKPMYNFKLEQPEDPHQSAGTGQPLDEL